MVRSEWLQIRHKIALHLLYFGGTQSINAFTSMAEAEGYQLVETFQEVETGKGSDALDRRPQLSAALKAARQHKAPIIVAKLDRLNRDVHFISGLMSHKMPFIVCTFTPRAPRKSAA